MKNDLQLSRIIAHRGASAYAPENTLTAMRKAHAMGAEWVEFDVMLTEDGEAIIMHDLTLARTTNGGKREVAETSYEKIAELDAGSWFAKEFMQEKVPTLVQLLELLRKLKLNINLEIKPTPGKEIETTKKSLSILEQYWPLSEFPPMISTQSELCLKTVHELAPQYCLGMVIHDWNEPWEKCLNNYGCSSVSVNHLILNAENVQDLKKRIRFVLAYTVNDSYRAKELLDWGVDAVFTDKPDLIP